MVFLFQHFFFKFSFNFFFKRYSLLIGSHVKTMLRLPEEEEEGKGRKRKGKLNKFMAKSSGVSRLSVSKGDKVH